MFKQAALVLLLSLSLHAEWIQLESHGPHFTNTYKEPYVLMIAYNNDTHPGVEKEIKGALESLKDSEFVQEHGIILEWADCVQNEFWNKHYDLEGRNGLRFFIKNQMTIMPEFNEKVQKMLNREWTPEELKDSVLDLMRREIDDLVRPVSSLNELKQRAQNEQVVVLYMGDKSQNYDRYFQFARKNSDATFLYNFELSFKQEVFKMMSGLVVPKGDVFAIVKSEDMLDSFNPLQVVWLESFDSEAEMSTFFEHERYPKLRDDSFGNMIVKKLFFKHQILVLYAYKETANPQNRAAYEEAVKVLPNKLIYGISDTESKDSASFLQLFMMSQQMLMPETLSLMYVTPGKKVRIESFRGEFRVNAIVDFVYDHYKRLQPLIKQMSSHLYDMEDLTPKEEEVVTEEL